MGYWTFPPWTANVFVARLFVSSSSGIVFAGSTATSTVCVPFWSFADHCAATVVKTHHHHEMLRHVKQAA